jgi:signal transduction histidine kinase
MDYLRHHLGQGVARARPELSSSEQQSLIDQIIKFIEDYSQPEPPRTVAADAKRDAASHNGRWEERSTRFEPGTIGFVICCRADGQIAEVIQDSLGHGSRLAPDVGFSDIVSPFHSRKATRFLRSIRPNHASYDCALSVAGRSGMIRLFCSGFSVGSLIVILGVEEPLATSIPEELSRLAAKKPARLGPVVKELAAWRANQKSAPLTGGDDRPHTSGAETHSETIANHSTRAGRRRLLELAAHDLRNPVSGILAACQYLMEDASKALEPHQVLILCSIESSTRLALQLIQDLSEIPSIQLGKPQLELRPTDLVAVVNEAVSAVRPLADSMKVKVQVRVREQIPAVTGDPIRLREALHGLLVNAIGPSPAAGQIEMTVGIRSSEPTILLHREYATAAGRPATAQAGHSGPRNSHRRLADIHAALLLARTRRIVEAHGGAMRVATPGKHEHSWTVTLPAPVGQVARKK